MADGCKSPTKPIRSLYARQIFDSRGNPTVEVDIITDLGLFRADVPAGASTGKYEALELRDQITAVYSGLGVTKAIENINITIAPELIKSGLDVTQQSAIDELLNKLDGTENKSRLGANAIIGVSLVVCKAGAAKRGLPLYRHIADLAGNKTLILPVPAFNIINGGKHSGNKLAIQEFLIMPTGANSFTEAMRMGCETYAKLRDILKKKYGKEATAVSDEGGFAPAKLSKNLDVLNLLVQAIKAAGYTGRVDIGIDCAASEFYQKGIYNMAFKDPKNKDKKQRLTPDKLAALYKGFIKKYPIVFIEDPYDQDDYQAWAKLTSDSDIEIIGDDLTVSNIKRIQTAMNKKACNGIVLKINEIGTITETIKAFLLAKSNGWATMVSHRSGETEDTFIADLVVGLSAGQIKTGAPCRSECLSKYNQLLRIEEELGQSGRFAGKSFRNPQ